MGRKGSKRIIYVDFESIESKSYRTLNSFEREIIDKMIEMNQPTKEKLSTYVEALIDLVKAALKDLSPKQREVINYSFGLDNYPYLTVRQTAETLGLSRQAVNQIKQRALTKLRKNTILNTDALDSIKKTQQ